MLVEFALILPLMLLVFAVIVEGTRMLNSYQMAVEGVREAGRYLARTAPIDVCLSGGNLSGYSAKLKTLVEQDINGNAIMPAQITVNSVTPTHVCVAGSYRTNPAPVAVVTANMTIQFPFGSIFSLFGSSLTSVTTNVTDRARIFGT